MEYQAYNPDSNQPNPSEKKDLGENDFQRLLEKHLKRLKKDPIIIGSFFRPPLSPCQNHLQSVQYRFHQNGR
jgi:hypothetical protein